MKKPFKLGVCQMRVDHTKKQNITKARSMIKEAATRGSSLVVLPDDDFRDFVELSTEVVARTRIDADTGTVASGALFYEEYLPQESVLYTLALAAPVFQKEDAKDEFFKQEGADEASLVLELFRKGVPEVIQIGGNATIGKGLVRLSFPEV